MDGVAVVLEALDTVAPCGSSIGQVLPSIALYVDQFVKSEGEVRMMLDIFRNESACHFPFVIVSPWTTFNDLKEKKPFLLLNALMVACRHDVPQQGAIAKVVREVIGQRMLLRSEQTLDILQGLLLYLAWYSALASRFPTLANLRRCHLHLHLGSQITTLIHLIMSLVIDLGLQRNNSSRRFAKPQREYFQRDCRGENPAPRTLEERRTYLGCFYLTSM